MYTSILKSKNSSFLALSIGISALLFVTSCQSDGGSTGASSDSNKTEQTTSSKMEGVNYKIHSNNSGSKAQFGDFITLHMQYTTEKDSVIFTSYDKVKPLSFKFQENLFKGVLNAGLQEMAAGDSATFDIEANVLYGDALPNFVKDKDKIKYTISLQKIQSQQEYQEEQASIRKKQLTEDNQKIEKYLAAAKGSYEILGSGLRYKMDVKGNGPTASTKDIIQGKYTIKLLNGELVEDHSKSAEEIRPNRQPRGFREGLQLLRKGSKASFIVPSTLGYGARKRNSIPPNSVLVYDIEVESIEGGK